MRTRSEEPSPTAGTIVLVDWRDRHLTNEPGSVRPSIVVSDASLLPKEFGVLTVVPLTGDARIAIAALSVLIMPNESNGITKRSFALAYHVQSIAVRRIIRATPYIIDAMELRDVRNRIASWLALRNERSVTQ